MSRTYAFITNAPVAGTNETIAAITKDKLPEKTIVEASTFKIADKQRAEEALRKAGHVMLDCPVSGTGAQAARKDLVIFGSGEEIDAEFSNASLPPLPSGWKRDYFFYANGFVKDMDFYEAMPFTVAEMPFHEMSTYPYSTNEHYPEDNPSVQYRLNWNDRFESGDRKQRFQFNYMPTVSHPITH